ncbi:MAG TPA: DUF3179 domain-containing (seleno)protein, partial [Pirellulales bacterium]|nr:DUF3179 domain-containing (seleno)protein [Pirellulales bacterium]
SVAYHMFDKYRPQDVPRSDSAESVSTRLQPNPRDIDGQTRVIGLALDGRSKAWPLAALEAAGGVSEDELAGQKLLVLWYAPTQTAAIYSPEIEDADPGTKLTLVRDGTDKLAPFRDRQTGSSWGVEGRAIDGPYKGKTLRWLPAVQCRWFAWAAEYPETELHTDPRGVAPPADEDKLPGRQETPAPANSGSDSPHARPLSAVIVEPDKVRPQHATGWRRDGYRAAAVMLDDRHEAAVYRSAAQTLADAGFDLYYWIEVGRNSKLADAHPEWMASLGSHPDWQTRFPQAPLPKSGEVAKAYPWVPIGYRAAYDAHLARIAELLSKAEGNYRGLILNDLQGGPASCGCGNLQCRWAIDYHVASTTAKLSGDDVASRFVADVRELAPGKQIIPVWLTECEDRDLPADRRPSGKTTGYCGGVGCSQATCPQVFTKQWNALVSEHDGPIALLALHKELDRDGSEYGGLGGWISQTLDYLDETLARHSGKKLPTSRLCLVVQGYDLPAESIAAARQAAMSTGVGVVFVALSRIDQSFEPRAVNATP